MGCLKCLETDLDVSSILNEVHIGNILEICVETMTNLDLIDVAIDEVEGSDKESEWGSEIGVEWLNDSDNEVSKKEGGRDGDDLFDQNVDLSVEYGGIEDKVEQPTLGKSMEKHKDKVDFSNDALVEESDSHGGKSDSKWPIFRVRTNMKAPTFSLGMTFASEQEFKEVVHNYAIKNGK